MSFNETVEFELYMVIETVQCAATMYVLLMRGMVPVEEALMSLDAFFFGSKGVCA